MSLHKQRSQQPKDSGYPTPLPHRLKNVIEKMVYELSDNEPLITKAHVQEHFPHNFPATMMKVPIFGSTIDELLASLGFENNGSFSQQISVTQAVESVCFFIQEVSIDVTLVQELILQATASIHASKNKNKNKEIDNNKEEEEEEEEETFQPAVKLWPLPIE